MPGAVKAIPLTNFDSAALDPILYQPINVVGIPHACFLLRIVNDSNGEVVISYDGEVGHDLVLSNSELSLNFQANSQPPGYLALFKKGSQVFVRGNPGVGTINLIGYYVGV